MLFLLFELGHDRYALDVRQIAAVLPLVAVKRIPRAPPAVEGLLNYRGAPVPVIDVSQLTLGRPPPPAEHAHRARPLSGRRRPDPSARPDRRAGDADRATRGVGLRRVRCHQRRRPYLGPVVTDARGCCNGSTSRTLLPPSFRDMLFKQPGTMMGLGAFENLLKASMGLSAASIGSAAIERAVQERLSPAASTIRMPIWNASAVPPPNCRR